MAPFPHRALANRTQAELKADSLPPDEAERIRDRRRELQGKLAGAEKSQGYVKVVATGPAATKATGNSREREGKNPARAQFDNRTRDRQVESAGPELPVACSCAWRVGCHVQTQVGRDA
ncbi:MAG: hypothetical protein HY720_14525 [Planctomycetes bacterium]|nr:hypothetical protein [Planctomycetota bacterium]